MKVTNRQHASMLSPEVAGSLSQFHWHWRFVDARCLMKDDDHGPQGMNPPIIPFAPATWSRVYTGLRETGSFNHHSQIVKFKGKYIFAFSNGIVNEEAQGQRIMISSSDDAVHWGEAICVAGDKACSLAHNCVGMLATDDMLYIFGMSEDCITDASVVGMRRIVPNSTCIDVYGSKDGLNWDKVYSFGDKFQWIFEAPRLTKEGRRMCVCSTKRDGPAVLLWPGESVCADPEVIAIPQPEGAVFPYGESSWYQTEEGRIITFWRDEGGSCRLYVSYSDDNGHSWAPPMISDIPDSMSRVYAGRLADGRYFLVNNAFGTLLDRRHLMLLLSDDGLEFNKVFVLRDDPTSQRLNGILKVDGYQYPCCLVEKDKLFVGHSINKEDIECTIIDVTKI
jgi:hypothetical protein